LRLTQRLERLEAGVPKTKRRIILAWVDENGRATKAADTDPLLPDTNLYNNYCFPYMAGGVCRMLIRRRIEKLESFSPRTIANLVDQIEREAMKALSRDQIGL